ncbi:hNH endonuclease [Enterobacter kobei]|uniref:hNH endonuclease n=1 Tax=Enterobacter kobei TaxID=208224 RepID=UPI0039C9CE76
MSNKYEDLIKNARMNADCGEHMSPAEVTTLLNVVETTFAALAAENAWLKGTLSAVIDRSNEPDYQSIGMGCGVEDNGLQTDGYNACEYGWLEAMDRIYSEVIPDTIPETPATDAFLAEMRAQGVEMLTTKLQQLIDEGNFEGDEVGLIAGAVYTGADIAAQLRKGVQS